VTKLRKPWDGWFVDGRHADGTSDGFPDLAGMGPRYSDDSDATFAWRSGQCINSPPLGVGGRETAQSSKAAVAIRKLVINPGR